MHAEPKRHSDLHPVLGQLLDELGREDGYLDGDVNWVQFLSADAYVDSDIKEGEARTRIRAYPLGENQGDSAGDAVIGWVEKQPRPASGLIQAFIEEQEDGPEQIVPRLVFERPVAGFSTDHIEDDIFQFAEAWETRSIAEARPQVTFEKGDPTEMLPQNAWLLMGDQASYWTREALEEVQAEGAVGVYDTLWTAPKNGELGDLVLLYFTTPRKAACFVARLASRPFWRTDLQVDADKNVDRHQWWAYLTPPIEIEPIPYKTLQEAAGGYLPLRGKSGRYLSPDVIQALRFVAVRPEQQSELERAVRAPTGHGELPDKTGMTFDQWRQIPSGLLSLEAKVSEYVVEPLIVNVEVAYPGMASIPRSFEREYRVPSGYIDFVVRWPDVPSPVAAVEVKLTTLRPSTGVWADSRDFQQLRRYMDDLGTPGLLVDAQRLLLVRPGADAPFAEIIRAEATWEDLALIRDLLLEQVERSSGGRDVAAKRFVIVLGPHPMNPSPESDVPEDQCVVIADGYDLPVQEIESIGNDSGYELIKSYLDEHSDMTPRQAVGLLGMRGMYRVEECGGRDGQSAEAVRFEIASFPFMAEEPGEPFAIITVSDHDPALVVDIEPHPNAGDDNAMATDLIEAWAEAPSEFTVGRIAMSYGWMRQISGPVPEPIPRQENAHNRARRRGNRG